MKHAEKQTRELDVLCHLWSRSESCAFIAYHFLYFRGPLNFGWPLVWRIRTQNLAEVNAAQVQRAAEEDKKKDVNFSRRTMKIKLSKCFKS